MRKFLNICAAICTALVCLLILVGTAFPQAALAPVGKQQFFDASGRPLSGGKVYTYVAGTTTPLATYTDSTMATENSNPIVLDAGGFSAIWLNPAQTYKFIVKTSLGVTISTTDNLTAAVGGGSAGAQLGVANTWTAAQSGPFYDNGGAVLNVMGAPYGAKGNGSTDDTAAINAAIAAAPLQDGSWSIFPPASSARSAKATIIFLPTPTSCYKITSPISVPGDKNLAFVGAGFNGIRFCNSTGGNYLFDVQSGNALARFEGIVFDGGGIEIEGGRRNRVEIVNNRFQDITGDYAIKALGASIVTVFVDNNFASNCRGFVSNLYANNDGWSYTRNVIVNNVGVSEYVVSSTGNRWFGDNDVEVRQDLPNTYKWPTIWITSSGSMGQVYISDFRFGDEFTAASGGTPDAGPPQRNIGLGGVPCVTLSRTSNVATCGTSPIPHGLTTGNAIKLLEPTDASFAPSDWTTTATVVDAYTFTYPNTGADATAASTGGMAAVAIRNTSATDVQINHARFKGTNGNSNIGTATMADSAFTLFNPCNACQFTENVVNKQYNTAIMNDEYYPAQGSASSSGNVNFGNTKSATVTTPAFVNGGLGWTAIGTIPNLTVNNGADGNGVGDNTYQCGVTGNYDCYLMTVKDYTSVLQWRLYRTASGSLNVQDYSVSPSRTRLTFVPGSETDIRPGAAGTCTRMQTYDGTATPFQACDGNITTTVPLRFISGSFNGNLQTATLGASRTYTLPDATGTIALIGIQNSGNLLASGIVDGTAPITLTTGASATLGGTYNTGYTFNQHATAATAITYTLPTAAAGKQYCVKNSYNGSAADTGTITLQTSATGQFLISNGTLSATGGYIISAGAAGDAACAIAIDSTHWEVYAQSGTWTLH
jgi:hypothetical protein